MSTEELPALCSETVQISIPWQLAQQVEDRLRPRYLQKRDAALLSGDLHVAAYWDDKLIDLTRMVTRFDRTHPAAPLTAPPLWQLEAHPPS